jgi:hypothetical protein
VSSVRRAAYGSTAYGFIPFRCVDPMVNITTKHGPDERVLIDDLVFQVETALHVARAIGATANRSDSRDGERKLSGSQIPR